MKLFLKIVGTLTALVIVFLLYVQFSYKQTFVAPTIGVKASSDSTIIGRGRYIVENVSHCKDCHASKKNVLKVSLSDLKLSGGSLINTPVAKFYPPNLTPDMETGIGTFTDEQIARAIRYGIKHDGTAMAPFMSFNEMNDDDITAVISYLRASEPVYNKVPDRDPNILGKIILRFMMKPNLNPDVADNLKPDTTAAYGKYLASSVGNCVGCHTNRDPMTGEFVSPPFSGGLTFKEEAGVFTTPNLTPDSLTGRLKGWSGELFVNRFHMGKLIPGSPMPWESFQNMSDRDLKAIYHFLKSLPPVNNKVEATYVPAPLKAE